jgi:hypothetical protein
VDFYIHMKCQMCIQGLSIKFDPKTGHIIKVCNTMLFKHSYFKLFILPCISVKNDLPKNDKILSVSFKNSVTIRPSNPCSICDTFRFYMFSLFIE